MTIYDDDDMGDGIYGAGDDDDEQCISFFNFNLYRRDEVSSAKATDTKQALLNEFTKTVHH